MATGDSGTKRRSLPPALTDGPFTTAHAADLGVGGAWLQQAGLAHPTRGVWSASEPEDWRTRAEAMCLVLPGGSGYSHTTGARIHELPLPFRLTAEEELHVTTPTVLNRRRRPGWIGHKGAESRKFVVIDGLPVTDVIDTWIDLGSMAVGRRRVLTIEDLVVAGDEMVNLLIRTQTAGSNRSALGLAQRHLDPLVVDPVLALIRARLDVRIKPRLRGRTALEAALPMLRAGVKSPQESRARLMFIAAGLPEPLVNANIHADSPDGPDGGGGGGWLAEGDLVWRESKTVAEYQSEHHVKRDRRSADSGRLAILGDHDWDTHEVWAEDLRPGGRQFALIQRVKASLNRKRTT